MGGTSGAIAISYRRDDSEAITGRIFDRLAAHFGREAVFRDIDSMAAGTDFRLQVEEALRSCAIVIAVIGRNWRGPPARGRARILDDHDPVRIEIEIALRQGVPIVPVLVGRTRMPSADQLPDSLSSLVFRHACRIDPGEDFDHHADRLIREIERVAGPGSGSAGGRSDAGSRADGATDRYAIALGAQDGIVGPDRAPPRWGGYARLSLSHYPGSYLVVRPAFRTQGNLYAYLADITWDEVGGGLVFQERARQDARHTQQGRIWIPSPSSHLYMVSGRDGWLRSVTLSFLDEENRMRGIISTLHNVRGAQYVPVAAPIVFVKRDSFEGDSLGELTPDDPNHAPYTALLQQAIEEGAAQIVSI